MPVSKALKLSPLISVIIPVWHEPEILVCLQALGAQNYPNLEIWVVDGDPEGSSIQGLVYPDTEVFISPRKGRGFQLKSAAEKARGDIFLFLHADTRLPAGALFLVADLLRQNPHLAGGAFDLGIDSVDMIFRLIESLSSWRSRLTRLPYGDQSLFLRRESYFQVDGFPAVALMEDLGLGQRLKRQKLPIAFLSERVLTSPRRWQKEGILSCTLRNWCLLSLYLWGVEPEKLKRWYV
jgi:rSAM/selenodomain-associated transferase 2